MATAGGIRMGKVFVEIGADPKKFFTALNGISKSVGKVGSSMSSLGSRLMGVGAAVAAPLALATRQFASFDDAIRLTGAVSGAAGLDLQKLNDKARELGATTSFTAVQVATLMGELGRAGFKPDEINAMTGAVLDLARATGTDAVLSAGIMAATLRQFGLGATEAGRAADVLTKAANSTFNTVEGLGESLKYAGPVAKSLGMNLEDTVAILGVLGNVGIQGSEAGTALRRLSVISAGTGEKLNRLFGISNVDAAGNLKPLIQVLDEINTATAQMPVAERTKKMALAFGLLGITSANVLSQTAGGVTDLAEQLRNAEGTAARTAKEMDAGLGGSLRIALSAVEGSALAIGDALTPALQKLIDGIGVTAGDLTQFVKRNQDLVVAIANVIAGVAAGGAAIFVFGKGLSLVAGAMGGVASVGGAVATTVMTLSKASFNVAVGFGSLMTLAGKLVVSFGQMAAAAAAYAARAIAAATASAASWALATGPLSIIAGMLGVATVALLPAFAMEANRALGAFGERAAAAFNEFAAGFEPIKHAWHTLAGTAMTAGSRIYDALSTGDIVSAWSAAITAISQMFVTLGSVWQKYVTGPIRLAGETLGSSSRAKEIMAAFDGRATKGLEERRKMAERLLSADTPEELQAEIAKQTRSKEMTDLTRMANMQTNDPFWQERSNWAKKHLAAINEARSLAQERFAAAGVMTEEDRRAQMAQQIAALDAQFQIGQSGRQQARDDVAAVSDVQQRAASMASRTDLDLLRQRIADLIERDNLTADQEAKLLSAYNEASVRTNSIPDAAIDTTGKLQVDLQEFDPEELKKRTMDAAVPQAEAIGTFSSSALSGLGFGSSIAQQQLSELKGIRKAVEEDIPDEVLE
jgi:TP901 family phage tail tape measure protein